jgi:hypothetical protein
MLPLIGRDFAKSCGEPGNGKRVPSAISLVSGPACAVAMRGGAFGSPGSTRLRQKIEPITAAPARTSASPVGSSTIFFSINMSDIFRYVIASGVLSERTKSFRETTMVDRAQLMGTGASLFPHDIRDCDSAVAAVRFRRGPGRLQELRPVRRRRFQRWNLRRQPTTV